MSFPWWVSHYWYVWVAWPIIFLPAWWILYQRTYVPREPYWALREEVSTLRRALIIILESWCDVERREGGRHRHPNITNEDRRQIQIMLGIISEPDEN